MRKKRSTAGARLARRRLTLESLESRNLLAVVLADGFDDGDIDLNGRGDSIDLGLLLNNFSFIGSNVAAVRTSAALKSYAFTDESTSDDDEEDATATSGTLVDQVFASLDQTH